MCVLRNQEKRRKSSTLNQTRKTSLAIQGSSKWILFYQKQPPELFNKKETGVFENFLKFTRKFMHQILFKFKLHLFLSLLNLIKKETPVHVFSCEFCEINQDIYFVEHLRTAASALLLYEKGSSIDENELINKDVAAA